MLDLALHHLTIIDADVTKLVDVAADVGCKGICVFAYEPEGFTTQRLPVVTKAQVPDLKSRMADKNITVRNIDFFGIMEKPPFEQYRTGFEVGAALGAKRAVTLIFDTDAKRAAENLGKLGDIAGEYGLNLVIEFMTIAPGCKTIHQAASLIKAAGRKNIQIAVDALHLARSGGTPADVAALDPQLIGSSQLCDGPIGLSDSYFEEAMDRQIPGEGKFPLKELIKALPKHTAYDVETPLATLAKQGVSPIERARRAMTGARAVAAAAGA